MSDFEPVEIFIDLKQNVDTEGEKATKGIDEIAAASDKMRSQFEKDIASQKALTTQLINELKALKETMAKKVDTGDEKQIADKQKLAEQIDALNKKLIEQEKILEQLGKKQTSPSSLPKMSNDVDAYARQVRNLNFSMTQISRELPNFAISPMIGIMSLSNNLPMIQSDIQRMIQLNKELKESGQATIPVWKQIGSALFSWQTALIAGISALMLWGPQIGNWISDLFRAKDALKLTKDEVKGLTENLAKSIGSDMVQLNYLFDILKKVQKGTAEYNDTKSKIIDQYGKYLNGLDSEVSSLKNVEGAYHAITQAIYENARAKTITTFLQDAETKKEETKLKQYQVIRDGLIKTFGEKQGENLFNQFRREFETNGKIGEITTEIFKKADATLFATSPNYKIVTGALDEINKAQDEYNAKSKESSLLLGDLVGNEKKINGSLIEQAELRLKNAKLLPESNDAELIIKNKEIESAEKELERLKKLGKTDKSAIGAENKSLEASADLTQQQVDAELKKQNDIINLMNDGIEKQKALRQQAYREELADLDKQQKDYVSKLNDKLGKKPTDKGYVTSLRAYVSANPKDKGASGFLASNNEQRLIADQLYVSDVEKLDAEAAENRKKIFMQASEAFMSEVEKEKQAINEKYDAWIKRATEQGATQAEIDKLNELRQMAILQVQSASILKLSSFYQQLYGNIDELSVNGLRNLQTQLANVLASAQQINKNGQTLIQVSIPSEQFDKDGKRIQKTVIMTIEEFQRLKEKGNDLNEKFAELKPFESLQKAFSDYKNANKEVQTAQDELNKLQESGTASTEELVKATDKLNNAQNNRTASLQKTTTALNKIGNSGGKIVDTANELIGTLEDLGVSVGENTKKSIEGVGKMFDALAEIDLTRPMTLITSAVKLVAGLGTTVAGVFGMASKKKVISEETFAEYERLIDTIDEVISKQKELLSSLSGTDAKAQYDESIALIEKQIEATKNLGTDYLNSGADWKSHSIGYELQAKLKEYAADFASIGIDFSSLGGRATGLFDLSSDQLTAIKEQIPEAWAALDDKTKEYLQTLIDSNTAIDDLKASLQEAVTGISFDTIKDALDDLIQSVDTTWSDVADSFEEHMQNAVLNFVKNTYLTDALQEWYDQFAAYYNDNTLTSDERQALETLYKTIYDKAQAMYDEATAAAGIDTSAGSDRTGSTKGIAQASQESIDETNGRLTAIQQYIYDIRNLNAQSIDFEKEARAYESAVLSHLQTIADNTDYCKYLLDVKNALEEIKLKGVKIKS